MSRSILRQQKGFTLAEVLIVTALMGIVVLAVMGVQKSSQRTAKTSEEVAEVQQNMRIAMSYLSRDLRVAGFLVPSGDSSLAAAPTSLCDDKNDDGDCLDSAETPSLNIRTAISRGKVARIASDIEIPTGVSPDTPYAFSVATSSMCDQFTGGSDSAGDYAAIVRPADNLPPMDRIFRVTAKDRSAKTITLREFNTDCQFRTGDLIVWVGNPKNDPDATPNTDPPSYTSVVSYSLVDDPDSSDPDMKVLQRTDSLNGTKTVVSKLHNVEFSYILGNGDEVSDASSDLDEIVAVRMLITGSTDATMTGQENYSGVKTRQLEQVVKLRN